MAIALVKTRHDGITIYKAQLISAAVATGNGEWINIEGLAPFSIHVSGITTATVQIRGSNDATIPSDATHDIQLGSNITADGITEYTVPIRWIKAMVSAWTSGTITVELLCRSN